MVGRRRRRRRRGIGVKFQVGWIEGVSKQRPRLGPVECSRWERKERRGGRGEGEEGGEAELDHAKEAVAAKTVVSLCLQQAG